MKTLKLIYSACILCVVFQFSTYAQTQIGNNIIPIISNEGTGNNVSISADGNRVLLGSRLASVNGNQSAGAARVYQNTNGTWEQLGQIIEGENVSQFFGECVAITQDGNRIAIGSRDYLRIYSLNGNTWQQLGQDIIFPNMSRTLELDFSANGEILAASFQQPSSDEFIQVYSLNGNSWDQMGTLPQPSGFDMSLSDSGTRIAMVFEDNNDEIKVFDFNNGAWEQIGQTILPVSNYYQENLLLSGDGNRLLIYSAIIGTSALQGFLTTYDLNVDVWTLSVGQLDLADENPYSVSLATSTDGNRIAIGTSSDDFINDFNSVQVFEVINNTWEQLGAAIQIWSHDEQTPSVVSMTPDGTKLAMSSLLSAPNMVEGIIRTFDYSGSLGLNETQSIAAFLAYPNPTFGNFNIDLHSEFEEVTVQISNMLGQVISTESFAQAKTIEQQINAQAGMYFVNVTTESGTSKTFKVIKK